MEQYNTYSKFKASEHLIRFVTIEVMFLSQSPDTNCDLDPNPIS